MAEKISRKQFNFLLIFEQLILKWSTLIKKTELVRLMKGTWNQVTLAEAEYSEWPWPRSVS